MCALFLQAHVGDLVVDYSSEFTNYYVFKTREEALTWARQVGRKNGMVLTIKSSDSGKHIGRRPTVVLTCERAGEYRKRDVVKVGKRKRVTGTKKCGCPFELKFTKLGM